MICSIAASFMFHFPRNTKLKPLKLDRLNLERVTLSRFNALHHRGTRRMRAVQCAHRSQFGDLDLN